MTAGIAHKWARTERHKFIEATGKFNIIKYDRISTGLIGGWKNIGIVGVGSGLDQVKELPRTWNYFSAVTAFGSWPGMYLINDRDSLFDGQRIIDGVIVDAQMVTLGYRLIGFNDDGMPTYADIYKDLIHFNYSQARRNRWTWCGVSRRSQNPSSRR